MNTIKNSRRDFFKKGLVGTVALSTASVSKSVSVVNQRVNMPDAKRIVLIALDGICVGGFQQAKTSHLDALLREGALSLLHLFKVKKPLPWTGEVLTSKVI